MTRSSRTRSELAARTSEQLAELAIQDHRLTKEVVSVLRTREPDEHAARRVCDAYSNGEAPPFLAALLLGAIRHPLGHSFALAILMAGAGRASEDHAASAIARIGARSAENDLVKVIHGAKPRQGVVRRAAARGLGELGTPSAIRAVLDALMENRITARTAACALAKSPLEAGLLLEWLRDGRRDVERLFVGMYVAQRLAFAPRATDAADVELGRSATPELLDALRAEVADDLSPMWAGDRKTIGAWLGALDQRRR